MDTKQKVEVMQAYLDGEQIEQIYATSNDGNWCYSPNPVWNWYQYNYRVKPKPKYRPLKPEELIELKGKWLKNKADSVIAIVTGIDSEEGCVNMLGIWWSIKELHVSWNHEDGSPVGKIEE